MKIKKMFILLVLPLLLIIGSCSFISNDMVDSNEELAARLMIPQNAEIASAELWVRVADYGDDNFVVNLHRVTDSWEEYGVTWGNFSGAYDLSIIDSVTMDSLDGTNWYQFNIKSYLEEWIAGDFTHYGLLFDQVGGSEYDLYNSRESSDSTLRPYIKVSFLVNEELLEEDPEEITADAYIWEYAPDYNGGDSSFLYTTDRYWKKQTLVNFQLEEEIGELVGTGTPGYWKNHPEAWPVDMLEIGGINYTKEDAIGMMMLPIKKYKWFTMFNSLVAAKLNVLVGAGDTVIADYIAAADIWLVETTYKESKANLDPWQIDGEDINSMLDDYNNGLLEGAPSRDTLE